jgi:hypothetical protein
VELVFQDLQALLDLHARVEMVDSVVHLHLQLVAALLHLLVADLVAGVELLESLHLLKEKASQ